MPGCTCMYALYLEWSDVLRYSGSAPRSMRTLGYITLHAVACMASYHSRESSPCQVSSDRYFGYSLKGAKMQEELWPPNPKELDIAAVTSSFCFSFATMSMPEISSIGFCKQACQSQIKFQVARCSLVAVKQSSQHVHSAHSAAILPQQGHTWWLMVGWTSPRLMAIMVAMASTPAAAPRQCPIIDLVAFILM